MTALRHIITKGDPVAAGRGIAFVAHHGREDWGVTWEDGPNVFAGMGTQGQVREFLLSVEPHRVVIWDGSLDNYVDLDPRSNAWPTRSIPHA